MHTHGLSINPDTLQFPAHSIIFVLCTVIPPSSLLLVALHTALRDCVIGQKEDIIRNKTLYIWVCMCVRVLVSVFISVLKSLNYYRHMSQILYSVTRPCWNTACFLPRWSSESVFLLSFIYMYKINWIELKLTLIFTIRTSVICYFRVHSLVFLLSYLSRFAHRWHLTNPQISCHCWQ